MGVAFCSLRSPSRRCNLCFLGFTLFRKQIQMAPHLMNDSLAGVPSAVVRTEEGVVVVRTEGIHDR